MSDNELFIDHSHHDEPADNSLKIDHSSHRTTKTTASAANNTEKFSDGNDNQRHKLADSRPKTGMQTIVQIMVYREVIDHFEYLLLKRIDDMDQDFWQIASQPMAVTSTISDALRDATSQIGLHGFKHWSQEMHSYEWYTAGERGKDVIFAAELDPKSLVSPDPARYSDYAWLAASEASQRLKWSGNRDALLALDSNLVADRRAHPLPPVIGLYPNRNNPAQDPNSPISHNGNPAGQHPGSYQAAGAPNARIPQRLPDVPPNPHPTDLDGLPIVTEDTSNTSALFL